jgi:hypothetical protein
MRKLHSLYILFTLILFSCKNEIKKDADLSINNTKNDTITKINNDTIVQNIKKSCDESKEKSIDEYFLCQKWDLLNEKQIKAIIKNSKKGDDGIGDSHTLHYATSEFSIFTTADIKIKDKLYKIKIYAGSYFYLTDSENKTTLYFCENKNLRNYFITGIGPEDDEIYEKKQLLVNNEIKTLNTDLSSWIGFYEFDNGTYEQGYKNYHIKIEKNNCIFYQGDLPAEQIYCKVLIFNDQLYLYQKEEIKNAEYDVSYLQNSQQGDYLFKIFKVKNKYFVKTNLIKYLDDKTKEFVENYNIELIKK